MQTLATLNTHCAEMMGIMDAQKYKTMGAAGSMEDLENLVKKKMYWSKLDLKQVSDKEWQVIIKGKPSDMRVIKKGNRYQLQYPNS